MIKPRSATATDEDRTPRCYQDQGICKRFTHHKQESCSYRPGPIWTDLALNTQLRWPTMAKDCGWNERRPNLASMKRFLILSPHVKTGNFQQITLDYLNGQGEKWPPQAWRFCKELTIGGPFVEFHFSGNVCNKRYFLEKAGLTLNSFSIISCLVNQVVWPKK